jgi:hypothetical protein
MEAALGRKRLVSLRYIQLEKFGLRRASVAHSEYRSILPGAEKQA